MSIKHPLAFWLAVILLFAMSAPASPANAASSGLDSGLSNVSDSGSSPAPGNDLLSPDTGVVVLTRFDEPNRTDAVAFAQGTSREVLSNWFYDVACGFTGYDTLGNYYDLMAGAWILDDVDTDTPGLYYAYAMPDLENGYYTLADGISLPRQLCAVSIQAPGAPDINCCVSARGFLRFPWVLSAEQQKQLDEFSVWLRQNSSVWVQLSENFSFAADELQLSQRLFEYGSTYNLQVSYPGGQTGILTFLYDGSLLISDYSEGDRDGGDTDGTGSSTGSQPAPDCPDSDDVTTGDDAANANGDNETDADDTDDADNTDNACSAGNSGHTSAHINASAQIAAIVAPPPDTAPDTIAAAIMLNADMYNHSANQSAAQNPEPPVIESYSPTQTVISGLRVRDLCADEKSVVFGAGDLTVSIPSKVLMALQLNNSDTLSVTLTQPERTMLVLGVTAAGQTVTLLSGTILRLRYSPQSENAQIAVHDGVGNVVANTEFDGEYLQFSAETAGTYRITETPPASAQASGAQRPAMPLLPLASGGILLATGGSAAMIWRRRYA